jgi:hypothetical protein
MALASVFVGHENRDDWLTIVTWVANGPQLHWLGGGIIVPNIQGVNEKISFWGSGDGEPEHPQNVPGSSLLVLSFDFIRYSDVILPDGLGDGGRVLDPGFFGWGAYVNQDTIGNCLGSGVRVDQLEIFEHGFLLGGPKDGPLWWVARSGLGDEKGLGFFVWISFVVRFR